MCGWTWGWRNSAWLWGWLNCLLLLGWRSAWRSWRRSSLLRVERANLQLFLVLFQDALVVVLPELLRGVLSGDSLQDLLSTRVLVLYDTSESRATRDIFHGTYLEFGEIVDVFVNDDPEAVWLVVRRHIVLGVCGGHDGGFDRRRTV